MFILHHALCYLNGENIKLKVQRVNKIQYDIPLMNLIEIMYTGMEVIMKYE